jgi:succinoglycan biosynthesis protein ExoO
MFPKVSIIMSAYNTQEYIGKAIESTLEQTIKNIEIIIVDDASIDETLNIAKSFSDQRIKVISNSENRRQSYSLNLAISEAKGEWIAVLDSDDWFAPDRLEKLLFIAVDKNADMIADDIYFIRNGENLPWSTLISQSKIKINNIQAIDPIFFVKNDLPGLWGLPLGLTKPIFKREFLVSYNIKNNEEILMGQDFWFYLTCLANGANFILVPEPYYYYRSRPGSLVTNKQVTRLDEYCKATNYFLKQDFIIQNPALVNAIKKRLNLLEKTRPYLRVVDPLKQKKYLSAFIAMIQNPYFFLHLIMQLPRIFLRRIYYYYPNKIVNNTSIYQISQNDISSNTISISSQNTILSRN